MRRIVLMAVVVLCGVAQAEVAIYYTELSQGVNYIRRIPIDGGPVVTLATVPGAFTRSLAIDASGGRMYAGNDGDAFIYDLNGNPLGHIASPGLDLEIYASQVYLAKGFLRSANLDGSGLQNVYTPPFPISANRMIGFDFDSTGRLYYSDDISSSIYRDNLDVTAFDLLHDGGDIDMGAVEIDLLNSQLYWVQDGTIYRSGLDGNGALSLGMSNVLDGGLGDTLELDGLNGTMYWVASDGIHRAGLDGSNDELIHAPPDARSLELGPIPEPTSLILWSLLCLAAVGIRCRRNSRA